MIYLFLLFDNADILMMDSIGKECNPLKHEYDNCFNRWYTEEFINGGWTAEKGQPCLELFQKYRECVMNALKEKKIDIDEVLKQVIGTAEEKKPPDGA